MRLVDLPRSTQTLAIARCVVGLLMLWIMAVQDLPAAAELPRVWFVQIGPVALLPADCAAALLHPGALTLIRWAGIALAIAFALGLGPAALVGTLLALTATLAQCLGPRAFTGGFSTHHENGAIIVTLLLALAVPRRSLTDDAKAAAARGAMTLCSITIGVMYMEVGCHRLARSGAEIFVGDSIVAWMVSHSLEHRETSFSLGVLVAGTPALAVLSKAAFFVATLAEVAAPLAVLMTARWRAAWLGALVAMHVGSALMMNVHFWENLVLLLVFCSGLPTWIAMRWGACSPPRLNPATNPH